MTRTKALCCICSKAMRSAWHEVCMTCVLAHGWSARKFGYKLPDLKPSEGRP